MSNEAKSDSTAQRLAREHREQARWRWRGDSKHPSHKSFQHLVACEFLPHRQQQARAEQLLGQMLNFACSNIPYYRDVAKERGLAPAKLASIQDLSRLPELDKAIIREQTSRMMPAALPPGQKLSNGHSSSGTTGEPVRVYQTDYARFMRLLLTQRQLRWYRYDPMLPMAVFKTAVNLPRPRTKPLELGQTLRGSHWPGVGKYFATGPLLGFDITNPLEDRAEWMMNHEFGYLLNTTSSMEHLALAFQDRPPLPHLRGIRLMSEPLSAGQSKRIESTFGVRVNISYGLDETGWLATRCPEGGRYHVHTEHCLIEIVDEQGQACRAGEHGRVLVTILSNLAMPLIRYDTDDIALAVDGPCACGRSLPAFGEIVGRRSQMLGLPRGTLDIVAAVRNCMEYLPRELSLPLREYQVRQLRDGNFQLLVILAGPRAKAFDDHVLKVFETTLERVEYPALKPELEIVEVVSISRTPSKKFLHFASEFNPPLLEKDRAASPIPKT